MALKRRENGLTQKELAAMLFVSESAVSKWEQNRSNPDISVLPSLAEILGVTEHELITASVDTVQRANNLSARKWYRLSFGWNLFFAISYGITLLICFIVNLAVHGKLSWFFIVFSSLLLSASFTTLPRFFKKYRLLHISLSNLFSLILLLAVCCIYVGGDWFFAASFPVIFAFSAVFLPIYTRIYRLPDLIKQHGELFCLFINTLLFTVMLYVIEAYSKTKWVNAVAMPILLFGALIAVLVITAAKYLPIGKPYKTAIILSVFAAAYAALIIIIDSVLHKAFGTPKPQSYLPNFGNWTNEYVNSNIHGIIVLSLVLTSLTFLVIALAKSLKQRK